MWEVVIIDTVSITTINLNLTPSISTNAYGTVNFHTVIYLSYNDFENTRSDRGPLFIIF